MDFTVQTYAIRMPTYAIRMELFTALFLLNLLKNLNRGAFNEK
jgi:hypothetical protein